MQTLAECAQITRKGQEISLFLSWPGFATMTPEHAIELAHSLLEMAFEAQRESATTVRINNQPPSRGTGDAP